MEKPRLNKFYRVFRNDTVVTEVSFNDFRLALNPVAEEPKTGNSVDKVYSIPNPTYFLLPEKEMFYGYELKTHAMEMAKAGALKHIASLIAEGSKGFERLYQYRIDHYEDLNVTLRDSNIQRLKSSIN
jgi:hypothetical protein